MLNLRPFLLASTLALALVGHAASTFAYQDSDTRTLLTNDPAHPSDPPTWAGSLVKDAGDPDLYLNGIEAAVTSPNADPNLTLSPPLFGFDYLDLLHGGPRTYSFGTPISGASNWYIRDFVSVDNDWTFATPPAPGLYDITVTLRGGADANAWDALDSFDLHVDVIERLDISVSAQSTPILRPGDVGHVSLTVDNHMGQDFISASPFIDGFSTDPSDLGAPSLQGTLLYDWGNKTVAANSAESAAHSDWTTDASSVNGMYYGAIGVVGGLHAGDLYYLYADPRPTFDVQAVPEPAAVLPLMLGVAAILRRRKAKGLRAS